MSNTPTPSTQFFVVKLLNHGVVQLKTFHNGAEQVISFAADISKASNRTDVVIDEIWLFDEYGQVTPHRITFNGRFNLIPEMPEVRSL